MTRMRVKDAAKFYKVSEGAILGRIETGDFTERFDPGYGHPDHVVGAKRGQRIIETDEWEGPKRNAKVIPLKPEEEEIPATPDEAFHERLERTIALHIHSEEDRLFMDLHAIIAAAASREEAIAEILATEPENVSSRVTQRVPPELLTFTGEEHSMVRMMRRLRDAVNSKDWPSDRPKAKKRGKKTG